MLSKIKLNQSAFILYKWFNSLFLGVSIGSVFTIYEPLEPSVYSLGGIALAGAMIIVAKFYHKILNTYCWESNKSKITKVYEKIIK